MVVTIQRKALFLFLDPDFHNYFLPNTLSGEKRVCRLFIPIGAEHLAWETPSATEAGLIQSPPSPLFFSDQQESESSRA